MARRPFDIKAQPGFGFMALVTFFALYLPIAALVAYSFNAADSLSRWDGFSLRWFISAWHNSAVQDASIRSLVLAVSAAALSTIAATMAALATTRTPPYPGLTFKYAFINQPLMVPEIVTGVALLIVFSRIKVWTGYSGLGYLIAAHTAFCIPFAYLPIRARLESMDLMLERAAAERTDPAAEVTMTRRAWDEALEEYYTEHGSVGLDADARSPGMLAASDEGRVRHLTQTLADPAGHHDWVIEADVDLAATDEVGELVLLATAMRRL